MYIVKAFSPLDTTI